MPLTCGARSIVNVDRSMVNQVGSRLGFGGPGRGWIWARPTQTRGMLWRCHVVAMGPHWASFTAQPTLRGSRWTQVHGPWTVGWSSVDRVHPSSLWLSLHAPSAGACGRRGEPSASIPGTFPPVVCSPASSHSGVGI